MTTLLFTLAIAGLFALLVVAETGPTDERPHFLRIGLFTWLTSGNWPAKVGAGLLLFGVGALLRYALVNIDVPPSLKLGGGLVISAALAGVAFWLREKPAKRAIRIAFAGASAGVAYLTAYSAYGFFHYVNELNSIALLGLVAVATGSFAVSARSMSIAILAMLGAYLAPAFSLEGAGPIAVYGYYVLVSLLCLLMVALRGWRGLIHLSFLFAMAGGVFFAWSAKFTQPFYYPIMQPLLLALAAVHLAMPLVERKHLPTKWMDRFDLGYFLLLPLTSAVLMLMIAPNLQFEGAFGLALLGGVWAIAAVLLKLFGRDEALRHAGMAALLLGAALLCRLDDVPWILAGLGISVAAMAAAPRLKWDRPTEELLSGAVILFGFLHVLFSLLEPGWAKTQPFASNLFLERLVAVGMLAAAAWFARRRGLSMARLLLVFATAWLLLALADELRRLYIDYIPQISFGLLLAAIAIGAAGHRWLRLHVATTTLLVLGMLACGPWAASRSGEGFALAAMLLAPAVMLLTVFMRTRADEEDDASAFVLLLLPLAMLAWAAKVFPVEGAHPAMTTLLFLVLGAALAWVAALFWQPRREMVQNSFLPLHFWMVAICLLIVALVYIERSLPAILFECATLAYLALFAVGSDAYGRARDRAYGVVAFAGAFVVLQAMLLRMLGPPGVLTIADMGKMRLPAVLSLSWALLGAGLAWWGSKRVSRGLWGFGAGLLIAAAIKLVFFDFGSLKQLGNILALIAAGLVFLGVAWLAPIPPKRERPAPPSPPPPPSSPPRPRTQPEGDATGTVAPAAAPAAPSWTTAQAEASAPNDTPTAEAQAAEVQVPEAPVAGTSSPAASAADASKPPNRAVFKLPDEEPAPKAPRPPPLPPHVQRPRTPAASAYAAAAATRITASAPVDEPSRLGPRILAAGAIVLAVALFANAMVDLRHQRERLRIETANARALQQSLQLEREQASDRAANVAVQDKCKILVGQLALPGQYRVYSVGTRGGVSNPVASGDRSRGMVAVQVDNPRDPVVLMLSAYEPTTWNIGREGSTQIVAVLTGGHDVQTLRGLPDGVPVLASTKGDPSDCGWFYFASVLDPPNAVSMRAFGRPVDRAFEPVNGSVVVGENVPERIADAPKPEESAKPKEEPAPFQREGRDGLEDAVRSGEIRLATAADNELWMKVGRDLATGDRWQPLPATPRNIYVVQRRFHFPPGLYGADYAIFIVPPGVPKPWGDRGHSAVYVLR